MNFVRIQPATRTRDESAIAKLTAAERHILSLVVDEAVEGLKDIARARGASPGTIKNQLLSIYTKLGVRSLTQAALIYQSARRNDA